jgi:hypothetical protein
MFMNQKRATCIIAATLAMPLFLPAQGRPPELVATIGFDVQSRSGRVETLEVTIGDGGTGPYKAILSGDPGLPTHAIYRPKDLAAFGERRLLPIVAFANGGCRNTSGEFRNFLSDVASQGFLVVSIGPAGNSVVMGSEERTNTTAASQLLDGVSWMIGENDRAGSIFHHKVDVAKVAVMGQSCGAGQAIEVSSDPRVTTTIALNQGVRLAPRTGRPPNGGGGPPREQPPDRYAPYAPRLVRAANEAGAAAAADAPSGAEMIDRLHAPILFLNGGPEDSGFANAKANFDAIEQVPAVLAHIPVGHYPGTYRQPNGGAFAQTAGAWLKWQLKGDDAARKMFAGESCGLCLDKTWTIQRKNIQ